MKISVSVTGYEDIERQIKSIQAAMKDALEQIAATGGMVIETEAKILAPVKTGTLRRSISTQITESSPTKATASVGPHVDYGAYVEFGTRHMAARPYMRPAFEAKKEQAMQDMRDVAKEFIQEALQNESNDRSERRRRRS